MSTAAEFADLAQKARNSITELSGRVAAKSAAQPMEMPEDAPVHARRLCSAIWDLCIALPELPAGAIGPAGAALGFLRMALQAAAKPATQTRLYYVDKD